MTGFRSAGFSDRGFALPAALTILAVLSLIALSAAKTADDEYRSAVRVLEREQAIARADGAIALAIHTVLVEGRDKETAEVWPRTLHMRIGSSDVPVVLEAEDGKIDLNRSDPALLKKLAADLLRDESRGDLAGRILSDYRGRFGSGRPVSPIADASRFLASSPLAGVEAACLEPFVTVSANGDKPDPALAAAPLRSFVEESPRGSNSGGVAGLRAGFAGRAITVLANTGIGGGGHVFRATTVRLTSNPQLPILVHRVAMRRNGTENCRADTSP